MILLSFLLQLLTPLFAGAQTDDGQCVLALMTPPAAVTPLTRVADGRFLMTIDYTNKTHGRRQVALPSALANLRGLPGLKLVVLAGNSGFEYERMRHSLAYAFGDHLLSTFANVTHSGAGEYVSRETVAVSYDDNTQREWTTDFRTESPLYRTESGEVFYFPSVEGGPLLVVKMIGDYNETGDFAVPILDALGLPARNVLLVHDDLLTKQGDVGIQAGIQKYQGNNALFSMIRNMAYGVFPEVRQALEARAPLTRERWDAFEAAFRAKANVRYADHPGEVRAFDQAFKNVESISAAFSDLLDHVEAEISAPLRAEAQAARDRLSAARQPMGQIMTELNASGTSAERKAELTALKMGINDLTKPLADEVKGLEQRVRNVRKDLLSDVRRRIEDRLTFARLTIGTDDGTIDPADLPSFVLAPYPPGAFDLAVRDRATARLLEWMKAN